MGNMTGAMVFQSSFPVTVGLLLTPWELAHEALVAAVVALLAGSVLYLTLRFRGRLSARLLLLQGCVLRRVRSRTSPRSSERATAGSRWDSAGRSSST
jgi:hypothetical protein